MGPEAYGIGNLLQKFIFCVKEGPKMPSKGPETLPTDTVRSGRGRERASFSVSFFY